MKQDNQLNRIEEYIDRFSKADSSGHITLLDSEADTGATVITPNINDICTNRQSSQCWRNTLNCTNLYKACSASTNVQTCIDMAETVSLPGCG